MLLTVQQLHNCTLYRALLAESCLCCFRPPSLFFSACASVSLKRSDSHIWWRTQQLPDEGEDLLQDGGHSPACYITVVSLTSLRFNNIPPLWMEFTQRVMSVCERGSLFCRYCIMSLQSVCQSLFFLSCCDKSELWVAFALLWILLFPPNSSRRAYVRSCNYHDSTAPIVRNK